MQVGDVVITTSGKIFRISGIYLGAAGKQSFIGLRGVDNDSFVQEHTVPVELIVESGAVYRRVS